MYANDVLEYSYHLPGCGYGATIVFGHGWLALNCFLLNQKLFIWLGNCRWLSRIWWLKPSRVSPLFYSVWDLGTIYFGQELIISGTPFLPHINQLTHSGYHQLRQLRTVCQSLSHDMAVTLVCAFDTSSSWFDHYCSVFVGLPIALLVHLDSVLHSAACLVGHVSKYAPVLPYIPCLNLPVLQQISCRIAAPVWCCLGIAPAYLQGRPVTALWVLRVGIIIRCYINSVNELIVVFIMHHKCWNKVRVM